MSVKQLPNLTKILLVESQGDNVAQQPYYQKGDIVEYIGSDDARLRVLGGLGADGGADGDVVRAVVQGVGGVAHDGALEE